jgi:two-component system, OmpR family, alkaline phosphatase synthesis response regulator PhoP
MSARILLIEHEPALVQAITDALTRDGYEAESANSADSGLVAAAEKQFDLIVLDAMLPGRNGFEVLQELRRKGVDTPILMLTAQGQVLDREPGVKLGVDDYMMRPFEAAEMPARIGVMLRRSEKERRGRTQRFQFGNVEVDFERGEVKKKGKAVNLASKEMELLKYLIENRDRVVLREELMTHVWDYASDASSRTIDTHVAWLRQKLEDNPQSPRYILTIRGQGYRFTE